MNGLVKTVPWRLAGPGTGSVVPTASSSSGTPARREDGRTPEDVNPWWPAGFGAVFLASGLAHLLLMSLNPAAYDNFADASWWPLVAHAWRSVLVPNVHYLIPVLAAFELGVGCAILSRRFRMVGIAAAAAFNAALTLFGWGFFAWSLPALALLARFAWLERRDRALRGQSLTEKEA